MTQASPPAPAPARLRGDEDVTAVMAEAAALANERPQGAVPLLCRVLAARPGQEDALVLLEACLRRLGEPEPAVRARAFAERAGLDHPALAQAAGLLRSGNPADADAVLLTFLRDHPEDPPALRMRASLLRRGTRAAEAEQALTRALEIAPRFEGARRDLIDLHQEQGAPAKALAEIDRLIEHDPRSIEIRAAKAALLKRMRRTGEAVALFDTLVAESPDHADLLIDRGNALRADGRIDDAVAAYRRAVSADRAAGRGWWALADTKIARFDTDDVTAMESALRADDLAPPQRASLHFALASALDGTARHADAFGHYAIANALHRLSEPYDARALEIRVRRAIDVVRSNPPPSPEIDDASGVIFIIGMPRSGSTLVEQILAGHSQIEATEELPYLRQIASALDRGGPGAYPEGLAGLTRDRRAALRQEYLDAAASHRTTERPMVVDKAPANWLHIPLIAAILPSAKIIDARRHPLDCGFSNYTQRFGRGNEFSYSLEGIGHHYLHYAALMRVIDEAWPGRVHRIHHERLLADPEAEVRRMLDAIGVPFEEGCLRFHESDRRVFSASSEQVRRPLNRDGVGRWRAYEAWLEPLKRALGPVLDDYPA